MDKFALWMKAVEEESSHSKAALNSGMARLAVMGKGLVVEKHLKRIQEREHILSDFSLAIMEAPSLQIEDEEDWDEL